MSNQKLRGVAGGAWDKRIPEAFHGRGMRAGYTHSWTPWRGIWNAQGRGPVTKIPMLWGHWRNGENLFQKFMQAIPTDYDGWIIMFNEPADPHQANMPPDHAAAAARPDYPTAYHAAAMWAQVAYAYPKARLTSPQMLVGLDGRDYFGRAEQWLRRWWAALPEGVRPRCEAWAWHVYHNDPSTAIEAHSRWMAVCDSLAAGRQYWVTEWGVNGRAHPADGGEAAVRTLANYLDGHVDKHFYFMPIVDKHSADWAPFNLFNDDGTLTGCGRGWMYDEAAVVDTAVDKEADMATLENGSFEDGWVDNDTGVGYLINQEPIGWALNWVEPGNPLYDSGDVARGVPECTHKLATQLPPHEQLGAKHALILDGSTVYKIFHFGAAFGAELTQEIWGLRPGARGRLVVPIQAHLHNETDPYGCESGVWVDTVGSDDSDDWVGQWVNGHAMGDRQWYEHVVEFVVPWTGMVGVIIRVKSKWPRPKDFFIDNVQLEIVGDGGGVPTAVAVLHVPVGYTARVGEVAHGRELVVGLPRGVRLDVVAADAG